MTTKDSLYENPLLHNATECGKPSLFWKWWEDAEKMTHKNIQITPDSNRRSFRSLQHTVTQRKTISYLPIGG
jgi:hypothetical protein